jgi:hypothetical protein
MSIDAFSPERVRPQHNAAKPGFGSYAENFATLGRFVSGSLIAGDLKSKRGRA